MTNVSALLPPHATGIGKKQFWIGAEEFGPVDVQPCGAAVWDNPGGGAGHVQYWYREFITAVQRRAAANRIMPKKWDAGNLTGYVYWSSGASTDTGDVRWLLSARSITDGVSLSNFHGTTGGADDTGQGVVDTMHVSPAITFTVSFPTKEAWTSFLVSREGSHANDTFTGSAWLIGVMFEYTTDSETDD